MRKEEFIVEGMMCANCKSTVEKTLKHLSGMKSASVNLATKRAVVSYDEERLSLEDIKNAVLEEGFEVFFSEQKEDYLKEVEEKRIKSKHRLIASFFFAVIVFYSSMGPMIGLPFFFYNSNPKIYVIIQLCLTIPVIILSKDLYYKGLRNLIRFKPSMESLVAVGTIASFIYSIYSTVLIFIDQVHALHSLYFESVVVILFLIQLGKYFEVKSLSRANNSINELLKKAPGKCLVSRDNSEVEVEVSEVKKGDIIIARPGDSIAVDGVVTKGLTSLDESMLSGESLPVEKTISSLVYAGTINLTGHIEYCATGIGQETMLAKIIKMVEDAQASKAPIERLADKVAGVFTKVVISIALIALIIWLICSKGNIDFSLRIFASILVIACPCALGLATPTAIIVGTGVGARNGILYKDAQSLENFAHVDTIFFDKTGTLTKGEFSVTEVETSIDENVFLSLVGSCEKLSNHPLAKAIVKYCNDKQISFEKVDEYKEESGFGIIAKITEKSLQICKPKLENNSQYSSKIKTYSDQGKSIVSVYVDDCEVGFIALADTIKEEAIEMIKILNNKNIRTIMLTGDNANAAKYVADQLKVTQVYSNILPIDKANIVTKEKENHKVAMVGDGINDSVALTSADIGITFTNGTDIAVEASDIVLTSGNIMDIVTAHDLSCKILRHIKQNLFFAFFYNCIGLSVAAGIFYPIWGWLLNPMIGALAMSLSSISVVSNALRINFFKKSKKKG